MQIEITERTLGDTPPPSSDISVTAKLASEVSSESSSTPPSTAPESVTELVVAAVAIQESASATAPIETERDSIQDLARNAGMGSDERCTPREIGASVFFVINGVGAVMAGVEGKYLLTGAFLVNLAGIGLHCMSNATSASRSSRCLKAALFCYSTAATLTTLEYLKAETDYAPPDPSAPGNPFSNR